jgi:WD40 repeat protein
MYLVENLLREEADLPRVEKLLDEYQPQPGQRDLRDTRWYRFAWLYRHSTPKTLSAHEDAVYGVAFAPDGKRFATASSDFHHWGEVKIWDTVTRQLLATLPSHTVKSVAFGRDGQTLVTTTRDGTIEFRDADTARLLHIFQHPSVPARTAATAVVSSRDGMMLGAAWEDGTVIVWDVPSRAPLDQFQHSSAVQSMAFAPDGRTVATGSEDGQLHVRVLASKTSLALHRHGRQSAHVGSVLSVAYSLDSTTLASGGKDCKVIVWNMGNVAELPPPEEQMLPTDQTVLGHDEPGHGQPVTGVVFAPKRECNLLATVSFDGTVQLWNLNLARPQSTLKGHMGKLYCVALSPDSKTLLVGSERGTVRLWDLSKRDELTAL